MKWPWLFLITGLLCITLLGLFDARAGDSKSYLNRVVVSASIGDQECFIWLGEKMAWSIRPFVNLGCFPLPNGNHE